MSCNRQETQEVATPKPASGGFGSVIAALVLLVFVSAFSRAQESPNSDRFSEGVELLESGDVSGAISSFRSVIEAQPKHTGAWFNLALALTKSGDNAGAIEAYRALLRLDPTLFEAHMNLAIALQAEAHTRDALVEATEGTRLRPEDPTPALFRAELLDQLDEFEEAEPAYRRVIELDPANSRAYRRLGSLYRRTGRLDEAYEAFSEAVALGAEDPIVFELLGDIASGQEDLERARRHYQHALDLSPNDNDLQLRLALVLNELGDYQQAISLLRDLPDVEPVLAESYVLAGQFADAAVLYASLTAADPDDAGYWLGLGRSYYELDRPDEAIAPLEHVLDLDPKQAQALGMLAAIYHQKGDYLDAVGVFLRLLELRPDDRLAHFMIATAYDNLENPEQALLHYNRFLELDDGSNDARTFQVKQRRDFLEKVLD